MPGQEQRPRRPAWIQPWWVLMLGLPRAVPCTRALDSHQLPNDVKLLRKRAANAIFPPKVSRIIGGQDATPHNRYGYAQISLQLNNEHQCGGSLVARDVIMTAGHCHSIFDTILIGQYDFANTTEARQDFTAAQIVVHPGFQDEDFRFDFTLILLDHPVQNMDELSIRPIRLNNNSDIPVSGDDLTVLGWGVTEQTASGASVYPTTLQMAEVPYLTNTDCRAATYNGKEYYVNDIYDEMMCAGNGNGVDACSGDSGAPLVQTTDGTNDVQVGVVSFGRGCALLPGVYSRVSSSYDWLRDGICDLSTTPPAYLKCNDSGSSAGRTSNGDLTPTPAPVANIIAAETPVLIPVQLTIQLDDNPAATSWYLAGSNSERVVEVVPGTYGTNTSSTGDAAANSIIHEDIMLEMGTHYFFVLKDEDGDGIDGGWFEIATLPVTVSANGADDGHVNTTAKVLVQGNGDFARFVSRDFVIQPEDLIENDSSENGTLPNPIAASGLDVNQMSSSPALQSSIWLTTMLLPTALWWSTLAIHNA